MWRAIVLAAGLALCLLGGEFMVVDRLVLADTVDASPSSQYLDELYGDTAYSSTHFTAAASIPAAAASLSHPNGLPGDCCPPV